MSNNNIYPIGSPNPLHRQRWPENDPIPEGFTLLEPPAPIEGHTVQWGGEAWEQVPIPSVSEPVDPDAPYTIYKSTLIRRLTEKEATTLKGLLSASSDKMQMLWAASEWLGSDDPLFATLTQAISGALGEDRAEEILAREE